MLSMVAVAAVAEWTVEGPDRARRAGRARAGLPCGLLGFLGFLLGFFGFLGFLPSSLTPSGFDPGKINEFVANKLKK